MSIFWFKHNELGVLVAIKAITGVEAWEELQRYVLSDEWDGRDDVSNIEKTKGVFLLGKVTLPEESGVVALICDGELDIK